MQMSIMKRGKKIFTRRAPFFIGATRIFQKSTSFEKYSMSFAKYSMSFAQKSAPLAPPVFIGVSEHCAQKIVGLNNLYIADYPFLWNRNIFVE